MPWPFSPTASSPSPSLLPPLPRCESLVTHFMGVVTAVRWGSRNSRLVSTGETRMRKRCLSRWLESEVMRSLKRAMPCIATTCVLPTSRGSHVASCSTSWPFSYSSSALSGSSASCPPPDRSITPIFKVKCLRLDTTISFSSSPFAFMFVSIRWTVWSMICRCRPGPGRCCGTIPRPGIAIGGPITPACIGIPTAPIACSSASVYAVLP
mmetsp:Transcript_32697/g.83336  ORF Transcript_32697/g.83336 Transcript_32697/m.83336 type:complete len:209 (-) Transcript_32697:173-799(-)